MNSEKIVIEFAENQILEIKYQNYKGESAIRKIKPLRLLYGSNQWHPEEQMLIEAIDLDKNQIRLFATRDIIPYNKK